MGFLKTYEKSASTPSKDMAMSKSTLLVVCIEDGPRSILSGSKSYNSGIDPEIYFPEEHTLLV